MEIVKAQSSKPQQVIALEHEVKECGLCKSFTDVAKTNCLRLSEHVASKEYIVTTGVYWLPRLFKIPKMLQGGVYLDLWAEDVVSNYPFLRVNEIELLFKHIGGNTAFARVDYNTLMVGTKSYIQERREVLKSENQSLKKGQYLSQVEEWSKTAVKKFEGKDYDEVAKSLENKRKTLLIREGRERTKQHKIKQAKFKKDQEDLLKYYVLHSVCLLVLGYDFMTSNKN